MKRKFIGHQGWISAVKWNQENSHSFVSASFDGTVRVWDMRSSLALHTLKGEEKLLAMDAKGNLVFAGGEDKKVAVFQC